MKTKDLIKALKEMPPEAEERFWTASILVNGKWQEISKTSDISEINKKT